MTKNQCSTDGVEVRNVDLSFFYVTYINIHPTLLHFREDTYWSTDKENVLWFFKGSSEGLLKRNGE